MPSDAKTRQNDRLFEYLDRALDLSPSELEPWLKERELESPELAVQLREFLAVRNGVGFENFLAGPGPAAALAATTSLAGRRVGAYQLDRELGSGGMGTVWLAHRADGKYEAQVAIKFLQLALAARSGAVRFAREGNLLARLSHPNIARLLDAGVDETGQPYLVLEYVAGEPIDVYCDRQHLGVHERIHLFLGVLAAVEHAHSKLILHRDLKPSNILVTAEGEVRLLDFGIAKLMGEGARAPVTELTQFVGRVFTPEFASPEQVRGEEATMGTDVYALGVLLFVLLSGAHPTSRPTDSALDKLRAVMEQDASRLSVVMSNPSTAEDAITAARQRNTSPPQLARELRGDLDNILAKALKKDPAERYPTVNSLADDLRRYLDHQPVLARPDSVAYRARMFVRRHRVGVAATSVAALALIGGVVATTWQAIEANRARVLAEANAREAQQRRDQAEYQAKLALANHEFLSQLFGDTMGSASEDERLRERLDRAREMIRVRYANDPLIHGSLLMQLAGRYAELNDDKREQEVMEEFDRLVETSGDANLRATSDCIRAYDLIRGGKLEESAPYVARGMAVALTSQDTNVGLECYRADAMLAASRGDRSHAIKRMNEWLGQLESRGLAETRNYLASLSSLAYIYTLLKDPVQAYQTTHRSRQLRERLGSGHTLQNYIDYEREAAMLIELGRFVEAGVLDDELARRFRSEGNAIPCTFDVQMASRFIAAARYEEARPALARCLPDMERDGPENYARGVVLDLALVHALAGNVSATHSALERYTRRLKNGPPTPREAAAEASVRLHLAIAQKADTTEVARLSRQLAALLDPAQVSRRSMLPLTSMAAEGALRGGDLTAAREQATKLRALGEAHRLEGKTSAWIGAAEAVLARADLAAADKPSARQHLALAREHLADSVSVTHPWRLTVDSLRVTE